MDQYIIAVVIATVLATIFVAAGLVRAARTAKAAEPKALDLVITEALHAYEHEVIAKRQAAVTAAAEAAAIEAKLAALRAGMSADVPAAPAA